MSETTLSILHFNDVYRVAKQKLSGSRTIDVSQFAWKVDQLRQSWGERPDGKRDGLTLFSGDLFSPSVESSVTRGSHMVPVMNEIAPDVAVTGNHEFDFGYPHLTKLLKDTKFPWLLSNVVDTETNKTPASLHEYVVLERAGIRIGFVGLIEEDWITTISSWPSTFKYRDVKKVGMDLSRRLRDPTGEHRCDLIIALTHARLPNDIRFAKDLFALSPAFQAKNPSFANEHGVDILLGGHDHYYYASKGMTSWDNYDFSHGSLGAEKDVGDVLVVKSGTDFRDLSELNITVIDTAEGSIRRKAIKSIHGKRHETQPEYPSSERVSAVLKTILSSVSKTLKAPVCRTLIPLDLRSSIIRIQESASGNWFADVLRHTYDDALCMNGGAGSDAVLICAGTLRGDTVYGPGVINLGEILEILPFEDPVVVIEMDGKTIWDALEAGLSTWPAQEGRFPVVSALNVTWDSRRPAGQRVLSVQLQLQDLKGKSALGHDSGYTTPTNAEMEDIKREEGGKMYKIVTREYMAGGYDGYDVLKKCRHLVDDEEGQLMSAIVRKYLLGAEYIKKMSRSTAKAESHMHKETMRMISHERKRAQRQSTMPAKTPAGESSVRAREHWRYAIEVVQRSTQSPMHYLAPLKIAQREHMSGVDCYDGQQARHGSEDALPPIDSSSEESDRDDKDLDLLIIDPAVDGRFKNVGRSIFELN